MKKESSRVKSDVGTHLVRNEPHAIESARPMNAKAYALGEDVMFWEEQYAHETTVVRLSKVGGEAK